MSRKPGRTAGLIAGGVIALGVAACGGHTTGSASPGAAPSDAGAASKAATTTTTAAASAANNTGPDGLTPPGTHVPLGQSATVGWVSLDEDTGEGAKPGHKLQVTVESITKGSIDDFKNIDLDANEKNSTPYYVKVRIKALGSTPAKGDEDPDIVFDAVDDRGQTQQSVTFLGTFDRCDDTDAPKPFVSPKAYESCLAYLMPGGGSIEAMQWNNGPAPANDISPYFDKPVVWGKG